MTAARRRRSALLLAAVLLSGGCGAPAAPDRAAATPPSPSTPPPTTAPPTTPPLAAPRTEPSPPPATTAPAPDVYAFTRAGMLSPAVAGHRHLVYVPNLDDSTVTVIDQADLRVVDTLEVGRQPQHVVPSWDLRTLWVNNNRGDSLTPIDPVTGRVRGPARPTRDPYNLYFTPDGTAAMVMAEALGSIDFYDPQTFTPQSRLPLEARCRGVNHLDFSPDGSYAIATCEFSGQLVKIDVAQRGCWATWS